MLRGRKDGKQSELMMTLAAVNEYECEKKCAAIAVCCDL